ncbi:34821_t:CDS:1, partial [Gigaspora margarita]
LKIKDWKLESLLNWAEEENIAIIEITEMNMTEREVKFLVYSTNKKYKDIGQVLQKKRKRFRHRDPNRRAM